MNKVDKGDVARVGAATAFIVALGVLPIMMMDARVPPALRLSTTNGFAPLQVFAEVRYQPQDGDSHICLHWGPEFGERSPDLTDLLLAPEQEGLDCRPPAARSQFVIRFEKGVYAVEAWVEGPGHRVLIKSHSQTLRVLANAGDPAGDIPR